MQKRNSVVLNLPKPKIIAITYFSINVKHYKPVNSLKDTNLHLPLKDLIIIEGKMIFLKFDDYVLLREEISSRLKITNR